MNNQPATKCLKQNSQYLRCDATNLKDLPIQSLDLLSHYINLAYCKHDCVSTQDDLQKLCKSTNQITGCLFEKVISSFMCIMHKPALPTTHNTLKLCQFGLQGKHLLYFPQKMYKFIAVPQVLLFIWRFVFTFPFGVAFSASEDCCTRLTDILYISYLPWHPVLLV